ncbi:hypothetical protein KRMM14A1259_25620 [Krasilnikovia sp. MM14-A1259]
MPGNLCRDGEPAVVLVSGAGGHELAVVHETLTHALRTPAVLITRADLPEISASLDVDNGLLWVDERRVRPAVVWVRHAGAATMATHGPLSAVSAAGWSDLLAQLTAAASVALPGAAPAGPGQLTGARQLGVAVPRTEITTDMPAAARRIGTPRVVVKIPDFRLAEPDPRRWPALVPRVVDAAAVPGGSGAPVVVQEYVPHARELRVYHLDGALCAFEVTKPDPGAAWTDPATVTVSRVDCPAAAAAAVRALCTAWNLRYGAFDLLVRPDGEPVFLEANPDGDWLWYEQRAGWHGVSFMAAVMVRELFVRTTSRGSSRC